MATATDRLHLGDGRKQCPDAYCTYCKVVGCSTAIYTEYPTKSYVCSLHSRDEHFLVIGRELRDENKWTDRRVRLQKHILHATKRYDTSARLRRCIRPGDPAEFLEVPEEEKALACAEYDRRIREAVESINRIQTQYRSHENQQLQKRVIANPRSMRKLGFDGKLPLTEHDKELHNQVYLVEFPVEPTEEQTQYWEDRLRNALYKDYQAERAQAAKTIRGSRSEINQELKRIRTEIERISRSRVIDPGNSPDYVVTQGELLYQLWLAETEILEWRHQLVVADPFHIPEPKVAKQKLIEEELEKLGMHRVRQQQNEDGQHEDEWASLDAEEAMLPGPPNAQTTELTQDRGRFDFSAWLAKRPKTTRKRVLKLLLATKRGEPGAKDRFLSDRAIRKVLPMITVLDYGVPAVDTAQVHNVNPGGLRQDLSRLHRDLIDSES